MKALRPSAFEHYRLKGRYIKYKLSLSNERARTRSCEGGSSPALVPFPSSAPRGQKFLPHLSRSSSVTSEAFIGLLLSTSEEIRFPQTWADKRRETSTYICHSTFTLLTLMLLVADSSIHKWCKKLENY